MKPTPAKGRTAVLGYARTPFGRFGGALRDVGLAPLGATAVRAAMSRAGVAADEVGELAFGVNFPGSERSVARRVSLEADLPEDRNAYTIDRACCSSLTALALADRAIRCGDVSVAVAGGVENLSRVPYFLENSRWGHKRGHIELQDQLVVECPYTRVTRAVQASNEAERYGLGRQIQDEWALRSQQLYDTALRAGWPADELVAIRPRDTPEGGIVDRDEVPRPDTTIEQLSRLPTINGSRTVTAGNAPDLSTGATALVLAASEHASVRGRSVLATLDHFTRLSGDPQAIATNPALAARAAIDRAGLRLSDIHVFEINEAFAVVPLVATSLLAEGDTVIEDSVRARTNCAGGAIAIGHPTGATAGRLVMTTIAALHRRGGGIGLVAICGGIGEAEAVIVTV